MLRILHIEDSPYDSELIGEELRAQGIEASLHRVERWDDVAEAIKEPYDIILCDYTLPDYDGFAVLDLALEHAPDTPFLFVSGTIGETRATETLKRGAIDYVLKDELKRLGGAVHRALREADERRQRRHAEEELKLSEAKLRSLSGYLLTVREEERKRIALEIHDELGQQLTVLKIAATLAEKAAFSVDGVPRTKALREHMDRLMEMTDKAIRSIQRISKELRPPELDMFGLVESLKWQVQEFEKRTNIESTFSANVGSEQFSDELGIALFRICQEALTNVARHAGATHVHISLTEEEEAVLLKIEDNGRGVSKKHVTQSKSLGLSGMAERARVLGGKLEITGEDEKGTIVVARLPRASSSA